MADKLNNEFHPDIIDISSLKSNILNYDCDIKYSSNPDYPRFEYGFNHYYHASKKKIKDKFIQFENKKKSYHVVNPFELTIDDYNNSIKNITEQKLKIKKDSKEFYKLWEILNLFDLIDINNKSFSSYHINNSEFEETTKYFYEYKGNNKYNKNKNNKYDFITIQNKYGKTYDVMVEANSFDFLLNSIYEMISMINNNGSCVIKISETFTNTTCKILILLSSIFNNVYIVKPFTSRYYHSELYIVCKQYIEEKNILKKLNILKDIKKNKKLYIVDIFSKYNVGEEIRKVYIKINKIIANKQFKQLNNIIEFIEEKNYFGDKYQTYRNNQIKMSELWIDTFIDT